MAQNILGLDINDTQLTAVVITGKGKDRRIKAAASVPRQNHDDLLQGLAALLEEVSWQGGTCVLGVPLSLLSLRNLNLPFTNTRKIEQILPFELEEHLLVPVARQIIDTVVVHGGEDASHLLVAACEKELLAGLLEQLRTAHLDPEIVCPACYCLARRLASSKKNRESFLLLYGDLCSLSMVLCLQGTMTFMRRVVYPEQVFTEEIFIQQDRKIFIQDQEAAVSAIQGLCSLVDKSLDLIAFSLPMEVNSDRVLLAGPMLRCDGFSDIIEQSLDRPVIPCDLAKELSLGRARPVLPVWQPAVYDSALSLALLGSSRRVPLNFRKNEFAARHVLMGSKKRVMAVAGVVSLVLLIGLGYLFFDALQLQKRHDSLTAEMERIFKHNFPAVTRIVDPLLQMRARIRELETPKVSMPLFTSEPRILTILTDISTRLPVNLSLHVSRFVVDQDSVRLKGTTDAFNNVNTIKTLLAKSPLFSDVNIVSASKAKGKDVIRFALRMQLVEDF